jgi:dipeptidyl aminopeptidase/acylaminoacyl peptidase
MKKLSFSALILAFFSLSLFSVSCVRTEAAVATPAKIIPVEDFFKNPDKVTFRISPDGKYLSYLAPYESRMNLFVQEIGQDSVKRITSETERDIAGYIWKENNRILFMKDTGGDENFQLYAVNIDGSNLKALTAFEGVRTETIDELRDIPDEVIIRLNKRNPQIFDPYRLNIVTGEMTMLAENPGNIQRWLTDHAGKLRLAVAMDGVNSTLLYRDTETEPFREVITTNFKEQLTPFMFTFDNKNLYAVSNIGRDKAAMVEFDPSTAKEIRMMYANDKYDVSGIGYSRKRKAVEVAWFEEHQGTGRHFFDEVITDLFTKLEAHLPGYTVNIVNENRDETLYIVVATSDTELGTYYLYNKTNDTLTKIADVYPQLEASQMAKMNCVTYTTRDSLTIEAYLTLPNGYTMETAKNLPVVVNPHGGPWMRDYWGFNPEVQFLANRGYAVFQMNFRGSTGFGREFWAASFGQWGKAMQNDITDGVNWLTEQGIADPKRIAIYGASYGGYATLAGLAFTPALYAAGVDYVGVSNLFTFMNSIPPYWKPLLDMMHEMVGNPQTDSLALASASPALHADKITAPLFVAQGANDPRVNKAESDQMVEAMKARGVEVEYMVKDNEGHGFMNEENRFDFYRAMEAFLAKHLK